MYYNGGCVTPHPQGETPPRDSRICYGGSETDITYISLSGA